MLQDRWVVVCETVLDVGLGNDVRTGGRPELGYALVADAATFATEEEARAAIRGLRQPLPLGWVLMPLSRLLPDLFQDAPDGVSVPNPCKLTECQNLPRCGPCKVMDDTYGVETVDGRQQREAKAREIYESWRDQKGWVPWVAGGNSLKQDEARREAATSVTVRCPLCGYQHGHAVGCANNPVDIALAAGVAPSDGGQP